MEGIKQNKEWATVRSVTKRWMHSIFKGINLTLMVMFIVFFGYSLYFSYFICMSHVVPFKFEPLAYNTISLYVV